MSEYPISAPCSIHLTKYMSVCFYSLFATNTALATVFYVSMYIFKTSPGIGGVKVGSSANVILISLN